MQSKTILIVLITIILLVISVALLVTKSISPVKEETATESIELTPTIEEEETVTPYLPATLNFQGRRMAAHAEPGADPLQRPGHGVIVVLEGPLEVASADLCSCAYSRTDQPLRQ